VCSLLQSPPNFLTSFLVPALRLNLREHAFSVLVVIGGVNSTTVPFDEGSVTQL
jgi:hypothetical protein